MHTKGMLSKKRTLKAVNKPEASQIFDPVCGAGKTRLLLDIADGIPRLAQMMKGGKLKSMRRRCISGIKRDD